MNKPKVVPNRLAFIESGVSQREEGNKTINTERNKPKAVKSRYTFSLPDALMEHAKAAVFYSPGLNLSALVEQALVAEIRRLERARGEEFPRRNATPRLGE